MDKLWKAFVKSGKIEDYLAYKLNQSREVHADSKRYSNKGTPLKG